MAAVLAPRTVILNRFDIDSLAGSGGMGSVYRAWDRASGNLVAVKVMHTRSGVERFAREAELLATLNHPGIVRFVAHGALADGAPFLVMEWLEGESLSQRVERETLTIGEALGLGQRIGEALGAAHRAGIVHRDLKPGNVYLVGCSLERVKIVDFGIARMDGSRDELTHTGAMLGTPGYMAPEQVQAAQTVGPRADVYALGALLFRCLTGRRLYESDNPLGVLLRVLMEPAPRLRTLRADAPGALDDLIARMLARDPAARPADGLQAARELWEVGQGHAVAVSDANRTPVAAAGRCMLLAQIKSGEPGPSLMAGIASAAAAHGVSPSALADGSLLVTPIADEPLDRQMARLGRAALALRGLHPGIGSVLVAEAVSDATSAAGFDRGVALLTAVAPGQVRLDAIATTLLTPPFEVAHSPEGAALVGVRNSEATFATQATEAAWAQPTGNEATQKPVVSDRRAVKSAPSRIWLALGALAAAGATATIVWLAMRGGSRPSEPVAGSATPGSAAPPGASGAAPASCIYERCAPVKLADMQHVDVTTLVPEVTKLAESMEPEAKLVTISLTDSEKGYFDARPLNRAASFAFSLPPGKGMLQVMLVHDQLVAQHSSTPLNLQPMRAPKCSVPAAYEEALKDGLPASTVVNFTVTGSYSVPGKILFQFSPPAANTVRFVDGETCKVTTP